MHISGKVPCLVFSVYYRNCLLFICWFILILFSTMNDWSLLFMWLFFIELVKHRSPQNWLRLYQEHQHWRASSLSDGDEIKLCFWSLRYYLCEAFVISNNYSRVKFWELRNYINDGLNWWLWDAFFYIKFSTWEIRLKWLRSV